METKQVKLLLIAPVIMGTSLITGLWIHGREMGARSAMQTITVTGSVKMSVASDMAKWTSGFVWYAKAPGEIKNTVERSEQDIKRVTQFIQQQGIGQESITLMPLITEPVYEQLEGYAQSQNIIGYMVRREVRIESATIDAIEKLAGNAKQLINQGIVPEYPRIDYYYTKISDLRPSLFVQATADAKARAQAMATGTGVSVGELRSARTGVVQILAPNSTEVSDYGAYDLSTRQKDIIATVSASFALQ